MSAILDVKSKKKELTFSSRVFKLTFNKESGKFNHALISDGQNWHSILPSENGCLGDNLDLEVINCQLGKTDKADAATLKVVRGNSELRVTDDYEIYASGWIICNFTWEVIGERYKFDDAALGITLDERSVFGHNYRTKFIDNNQDELASIRGMAIDFSVDDRPVTNSLNFLLEKVTSDIDGRACRKVLETRDNYRFWGWKVSSGWRYPRRRGFKYNNRWGITLSGLNHETNPVRGQRIYHYFGFKIPYPANDLITEMAEYGASILILHNSWKYIGDCVVTDKNEMQRVVEQCRKLNIKVLPYCTPYMIAHRDPAFLEMQRFRTDCLNVWVSAKDNQMTSYELLENWDCDELCLRCPEAFNFVLNSTIDCVKKYNLDGLYVDFGWPAQGLCNNPAHPHEAGLFNFYDYFRLARSWRTELGEDKIMIGHGGGVIIASDMLEGFDACLTGEAQLKMNPETIGQQFGKAPTLWTIQRTKGDFFRSNQTIEESIREGVTVHYGVGIGGSVVIASLDPAHHREMIALWQIYRAFPVEKAKFYNYLSPGFVELDNPEILYSLYVTPAGQALLILVNGGGKMTSSYPCVGVNIQLQIEKLGLGSKLKCIPMKGNDYHTFRIGDAMTIKNGTLEVPEIAHHEFLGFVLFEDGKKPEELIKLQKHLDTRFERMGAILQAKQARLNLQDKLLYEFSQSPLAKKKVSFLDFTRGRSAE